MAQGALAVVLVVLALPGRRRDVDDDLPEEAVEPVESASGEGRRARRLRAQAEAEQTEQAAQAEQAEHPDAFAPDAPPAPGEAPAVAPVPQQQSYDEWDATTYGAEYGTYDQQQYQGAPQYPAGTYEQQQYQADPYQADHYDPYAAYGTGNAGYDPSQTYGQGYDPSYDPAQQQQQQQQQHRQQQPHQQPPHGTDSERPDGSQQ